MNFRYSSPVNDKILIQTGILLYLDKKKIVTLKGRLSRATSLFLFLVLILFLNVLSCYSFLHFLYLFTLYCDASIRMNVKYYNAIALSLSIVKSQVLPFDEILFSKMRFRY